MIMHCRTVPNHLASDCTHKLPPIDDRHAQLGGHGGLGLLSN